MAFLSYISGDSFIAPERGNVHPKVPKTGYTPRVGDLVTLDASIANGVDLIAGNEATYGIVENINGWSAALPLRPISVAQLLPGMTLELNFTGALAKGEKIIFSSATPDAILGRTVVATGSTTNGNGYVVATGTETKRGAGYAVVEF